MIKALKRTGKCFAFLLICMLFLSACAGKSEITDSFDVVSHIDMDSVFCDGDYTNFNVITEDGKTIRFQGLNVEITPAGISMGSGAILGSLDYMGQIHQFTVEGNAPGCWIKFGPAYADEASVDSLQELFMGFPSSIELVGEAQQDLLSYETGFLTFQAGSNASDMLITKLDISYDANAKQLLYSKLEPNSTNASLVADFPPEWNEVGKLGADQLAQMKMEEPGSITSDIIAGIDHSSISQNGSSTFFCSQMSDGQIVRFEGIHISILEDGIEIRPESQITSLDALGKIYLYQADVKDADQYEASGSSEASYYTSNLDVGYGYTYSAEKVSVESAKEVHTYPYAGLSPQDWANGASISLAYLEPNFVYFSGSEYNESNFVVTSLSVGYNPSEKVTGVKDASFHMNMTGSYLEGEPYNQGAEKLADAEQSMYSFYLILEPDTQYADMNEPSSSIYFVPVDFYQTGDLKDAQGNVLDKGSAKVSSGTTLDITVGDYTIPLELEIQEQYLGASTMHDLVPYAFPSALGENHTLVVPVVWSDQPENASEKNLSLYRKALGRIEDVSGQVTDHSDPDTFTYSLSQYFDTASYGKFKVNSFLTDWYHIDQSFEESKNAAPNKDYADQILAWVKETYPDLDWSLYDQDGNGYIDSMIIINSGIADSTDDLEIISYGGAIHYRESYYGDYAGTQNDPNVNCYVTINQGLLSGENANVLIHEFSHNFGIIDYYDVTYSGIDAVGGFDMQSQNVGDWNAYSKLAVGWITPQVVEGLSSGQSVELTIGSMALTDDAILIPAAGTSYEGAFSEYLMIDLFSDDGVNKYDAVSYGLNGTTGVRISHVDARMEKRTMEIASKVNLGQTESYDIGTIHYANSYSGDGRGFYNIEVIQSGKKNTFTDLSNSITLLSPEDLFYPGDTFSVEKDSEFFYHGLMDDGKEFGYTISVTDLGKNADGTPYATIKITAN